MLADFGSGFRSNDNHHDRIKGPVTVQSAVQSLPLDAKRPKVFGSAHVDFIVGDGRRGVNRFIECVARLDLQGVAGLNCGHGAFVGAR